MRVLIVETAFGNYRPGWVIGTPKEIDRILSSDDSAHVRVAEHPRDTVFTPRVNELSKKTD